MATTLPPTTKVLVFTAANYWSEEDLIEEVVTLQDVLLRHTWRVQPGFNNDQALFHSIADVHMFALDLQEAGHVTHDGGTNFPHGDVLNVEGADDEFCKIIFALPGTKVAQELQKRVVGRMQANGEILATDPENPRFG